MRPSAAAGCRLDSQRAFPLRSRMRLSSYPYVIVRVACTRCPRHGSYRLARLADRYGSEMTMPHMIELLSADCKKRETGRVFDRCGAFFPDLGGTRPTDEPAKAAKPQLKVVR